MKIKKNRHREMKNKIKPSRINNKRKSNPSNLKQKKKKRNKEKIRNKVKRKKNKLKLISKIKKCKFKENKIHPSKNKTNHMISEIKKKSVI